MRWLFWALCCLFLWGLPPADARNLTDPSGQQGVQALVYGASTPWDVRMVTGTEPNEIVRSEQMFPVLENHLYYEDSSGAATIFIFENNLLVGMTYRSADDQYLDLTSLLVNNGDRTVQAPNLAGYRGYFPWFPLYSVLH
jgi:hypothetical protein